MYKKLYITNVKTSLLFTLAVLILFSSFCLATSEADCSGNLMLKNNLYRGTTDSRAQGEVSKLQTWLSKQYFEGEQMFTSKITGKYDMATAQAVLFWQHSHGLSTATISSGVGPKTRFAMAGGQPCAKSKLHIAKIDSTASVLDKLTHDQSTVNFKVQFPKTLAVKNLDGNFVDTRIGIDFGDKSDVAWRIFHPDEINNEDGVNISHTYESIGSYEIKLRQDCGKEYCPEVIIKTVSVPLIP